jgi:hypothetical protein
MATQEIYLKGNSNDRNSLRLLWVEDALTARLQANIDGLWTDIDELGGSAGSLSYTASGTGAVTRTVSSKLGERISVKDYGALGDGSTNDTVAIQKAIDAAVALTTTSGSIASRGATVFFPAGLYRSSNLLMKAGVTLEGETNAFGYGPSSTFGKASVILPITGTTGYLIDCANDTHNCGFKRLMIHGNPAACPAMGGIRQHGKGWEYEQAAVVSVAGSALYAASLGASSFYACHFQGLDPAGTVGAGLSAFQGAVHLVSGTVDARFDWCEIGASDYTNYRNGYCAGIYCAGGQNFFTNCVIENSDIGCVVTGGRNTFTSNRFEINTGPAIWLEGAVCLYNSFDNNRFMNNCIGVGQDGLHAVITALVGGDNRVMNSIFSLLGDFPTTGKHLIKPKWLVDDRSAASAQYRNQYTNLMPCQFGGVADATWTDRHSNFNGFHSVVSTSMATIARIDLDHYGATKPTVGWTPRSARRWVPQANASQAPGWICVQSGYAHSGTWASGATYAADLAIKSSNAKIYRVITAGGGTSTVAPSVASGQEGPLADGYVWAWLGDAENLWSAMPNIAAGAV